MLYRLGLWAARWRWAVIGLWVLILLGGVLLAPGVTAALRSGFGDMDTESRRALDVMARELGSTEASVTIVFASDNLPVSDPQYVQEMERVLAPLRRVPEVSEVLTFYDSGFPGMVAPDGRTTFAIVRLDADVDRAVELVPQLRRALGDSRLLRVWTTGGIAIFADLNEASERDLRRAEAITLPLVLVALVVVFGSLVAAGLPVIMGVVSIVVTLGMVHLLARQTDVSIFTLNIASFLGLGMAIDYSLLVVSRFREELEGRKVREAVAVTVSRAGRAILFSAFTSIIGLSGLLFFDIMMLRSLGIGGVIVIFLSMVMALTLLPALLTVLGRRVNALPLIRRRRREGRFWYRLSRWVMRHPIAVIVPVTVFLVALGLPFLGVKLGSPWASVLPPEAESRRGWELVEERFGPGELAPVVVVATSPAGVTKPESLAALYSFVERFSQDPRVARIRSIVSLDPSLDLERYAALYSLPPQARPPELSRAVEGLLSPDGDTTVLYIFPKTDPVAEETRELVRDVRAAGLGGGLEVLVTGVTADLLDSIDQMYTDFPRVVIYIGVATSVALLWLFRSVVLPLKAVVMNVMSILASFGALVLVFQEGYLQGLLGFTAEGFIEATVPILLFCMLFGISMDYEVFLLSRVKEEYDATGDNTNSVAVGMEKSGRVITSAALILVLVAAGFASGGILIVKALGFGTALAVFVDSTIVRALLVPALMRVMAGINWWAPSFIRGKAATVQPR